MRLLQDGTPVACGRRGSRHDGPSRLAPGRACETGQFLGQEGLALGPDGSMGRVGAYSLC